MRSDIVVISWWSNCLGLVCLDHLEMQTEHRNIYVVQVGKTERQKELFRAHLSPHVKELHYPPDCGAEDWRVRETVAREMLGDHVGLWFMDHDLFVQENCEEWLQSMDHRFNRTNVCLSHPRLRQGSSITAPAFWVSPVRFPRGMPSFARLPRREEPGASKPYETRQPAPLIMPIKDTLIAAAEYLRRLDMVCEFPLVDQDRWAGGPLPFPRFNHIGGLWTFASGLVPGSLDGWVAACVERFTTFYDTCPQALLNVEDPVLRERLEEFRQAVSSGS